MLFEPVRHPWAESILRAVTWSDGTSFFEDDRQFLYQAKQKIKRPLFAAVVRIGIVAGGEERMWDIARELTSGLTALANPEGNELIPLSNNEYDHEQHASVLLSRQSHRSGMLLNSEELVSLVHLPTLGSAKRKVRSRQPQHEGGAR